MIKFSKTNFIGNETGSKCELGDIFQRDKSQFIYLENIFEKIPSLDKPSLIRSSNPFTFTLTNETGVKVELEGKYAVPLEKDQVRIRFSNTHSAFVYLTNAITQSLAIESMREELYKYWRKKGYINDVRKYCLVNMLMEADGGKILFSRCNNTSVTLAHSQGLAIDSLEGIIDARVTITGVASSIGSIEISSSSQPVLQMVRWYKSRKRDRFRSI
jgi:hypothetical protein